MAAKLSKRGVELLKGRAEVEKQIIEETEAVIRKAWAKFYGPLKQSDVQALVEMQRDDGAYVLERDEIEHEIARSYWRAREGYFGLTLHSPVELAITKNDDWWSRDR